MSGRNMRNFVTQHRAGDVDKLVQRVKGGLGSNQYKTVDYDQLKALTAEKKLAGQEAYIKVKKLQEASKHGKEQNVLNQHKMVWHQEFSRLNTLRKKYQAEIDMHMGVNLDSSNVSHAYQDFTEYESLLADEFSEFKASTVDPVWNLREDLEFWLQSQGDTPDNPEAILQTVQSVRQQQNQLLHRLYHEQLTLEEEIKHGDLAEYASPQEKRFQTGIPLEAFDLECPSEELKASVLQEFIFLDQRYVERLEALEDEHESALRSSTGSWSAEDHFTYLYVVEQYPFDMHNRRTFYIDRLKKHLPDKSRSELVAHEDWLTQYKYYHERRKDLLNDWLRDRRELLNRTKVVFSEACMAQEMDEAKAEYRDRQQQLCDSLYAKVTKWRQDKTEAMRLEQELEASRREEEMERQHLEETKEKKRRQEQKDKILAHHKVLKERHQQKEEEYKERLEELHKLLAEQAEYDLERVKYRDEQQKKKEEEKEKKRQAQLAAEAEKEQRLEALREEVRPHLEWDPLRVWSETEAWQARRKVDEDINIQKPLFDVNTFTAQQITADPRFRLEQRLRDAGLQNSEYARTAFNQMKPLHVPRKDMESTLFK